MRLHFRIVEKGQGFEMDDVEGYFIDDLENEIDQPIILRDIVKYSGFPLHRYWVGENTTLSGSAKVNIYEYYIRLLGKATSDNIMDIFTMEKANGKIEIIERMYINYTRLLTETEYIPNTFEKSR